MLCIQMNIEDRAKAYHFLGTQDRHLVRLFHWINILEELANEVRASEQDEELKDELIKLSNRLIREVGIRTVAIFPCGGDT